MMRSIETSLAIVEKFIEILRARRRKKHELFSDIALPLFTEFQPMVDEYFRFFQQARRSVRRATKSHYPDLVEALKKSRKDFLTVRIKVTEMARAIRAQTRVAPLREFASSVEQFFGDTIIEKPSYWLPMTKRIGLIRRVERAAERTVSERPVSKEALIRYIDETLESMEKSWIELAASYAKLRVYCLQS